MDLSNIWLFLYSSAWLVLFFFYQKKKRTYDAGSIILISYLGYSLLSFYLYNISDEYKPMQLFPFIYLFLMIWLAVSPVLRFDTLKTPNIQKPSNRSLNFISWFYVIVSLFWLPSIATNLIDGITAIMIDSAAGQDIYIETMRESRTGNIGDGNIANLPAILAGVFCDLGILLFFYMLTLKNTNKYLLIGLAVAVILSILNPISESQRGPAIDRLFAVIVTYFALRNYYSPKIRKVCRYVGVSAIIILSLPIAAITISRFGNGEDRAMESVISYAGMQNLNFNNYGLDNGGIRYGDRTFPMFKRMLGFSNVPHNFWERRDKYPHLKIDDGVFIGFVGDFTLDFGPIVAAIIFILFTLFVTSNTNTRKGRILFHQLILLHFVMNVCMEGGMKLFSYADTGNLRIIGYFLFYIYFRLDYESSKRRKLTAQAATV